MVSSPSVSNISQKKKNTVGIILAAGMGKRMKTALPKVAHTVLGRPLLHWAMDSLVDAGVENLVVVISPSQLLVTEIVKSYTNPNSPRIRVAFQDHALGTGHAALSAFPQVENLLKEMHTQESDVSIVVGFGDTPAVQADTFSKYLEFHFNQDNACSILAFEASNPTGYGRIVRTPEKMFAEICEEKDCTDAQRKISLCNSGFLIASWSLFKELLPKVENNNATGEYYLTEFPKLVRNSQKKVDVYSGVSENELAGVNSQSQLASMAKYLQQQIVEFWMEKGVQFLNPDCVYLEKSVTLSPGVVVEPFVYLSGNTKIDPGARIKSGVRL